MSSSAGMVARYTSLDRASAGVLDHDREFVPIREPSRERSRDRGLYLEDELYGSRSARQSPNPHMLRDSGGYIGELQHQNNDLQRELGNLKKELELTNQKLGSSMHSIKTFWSPELKKERALRKEESTKYSLINEQLKLLNSENQKQSMMVRQLEEELRMRMRGPNVEIQQQMEVLYNENEHLTREIAILRDTIKELELRIETQKQTLQARDESIKKLLEMLQNKGMGKEEERIMFQQMQSMAQKQLSEELDELRTEVQRRDQELLAMSAKMKTLEEQHQDYQRHIAVLKESLCAKEEHYNMLQADVEEMRQRLEEKNRMIEKKTQAAMQAQQERNRMNTELTEIKDHMDIKDRKINVLQRKLDLHEANKKLQAGAAKVGADTIQERKQMEEQRRQWEEQRRQTEERAKSVDQKARAIEEKERMLQSLDQDLKKRKARMDQLEQQLQKSGGAPDKRLAEMQKALEAAEKEMEKAKEESSRSSAETERLLQLVQMTQEEQNSKEKQIRELQDALKTAQAKLKQATTAQQESKDNKDESSWREALETKNRTISKLEKKIESLQLDYDKCKDLLSDSSNIESWKKEVEEKNQRIVQLEQQLKSCENLKNDRMNKNVETQTKTCKNFCNPEMKNQRIVALKRQVIALNNSLKIHARKTIKSSKKDNNDRTNEKVEETWKQEMEMKNRRIVELEQEMALLENLLRENVDVQILRDLEKMMDGKSKRIEELEDTIKELESFLQEDVKEMRDLRYQTSLDKEHIMALERCIQKYSLTNAGLDKMRIIELEEMVTSLEDYVKEHDIDGLKRKLQDRECRIDQLENQIADLNKKLSRFEENQSIRDTSKKSNDRMTWELEEKQKMKDMMRIISKENKKIQECELQIVEQQDKNVKMELREKEEKMKEMEYDISEKDNKIQKYEQQIVEQQNKLLKMEKEMAELEKELYMVEDIDVLKETIRIKNERVQELEMEVNSLETSLGERIDVAIEELIAVLKEKEEIEVRLKEDLADKEHKIEELDTALRQSIAITDETERKFKHEKKLRKEADQRIADLEKKIAVMHTALAMKCITCKPFLYKIFKTEEKHLQSNQEKINQLQELHQTKYDFNSGQQFDFDRRETLKLALSEKDAHLALLEHSGIKTPTQADQAKKLKADKKILLDKLREEDEKSINFDFKLETIPQLIEKISDDNDNNNNNSFDDRPSKINSSRSTTINSDNSPVLLTTSCEHLTKALTVFDIRDGEDKSQIHQQDTR